jgi:lysophospholipase L1-like esterase
MRFAKRPLEFGAVYSRWTSEIAPCYDTWTKERIGSVTSPHLPDFTSDILNVREGRRVTTDLPSNMNLPRLLVFGGSTVFCADVRDEETWCSHLQRRLNQRGFPLRVDNFGRSGSTLLNRVAWATSNLELTRGDVILLYFGVNDVGHVFLPTGGGRLDSLAEIPQDVTAAFRQFQRSVRVERRLGTRTLLATPATNRAIRNLAETISVYAIERVAFAIREAVTRLTDTGCRIIVVLQPNIFTHVDTFWQAYGSTVTSALAKTLWIPRHRLTRALVDATYPMFSSTCRHMEGLAFIDATDALDSCDLSVYHDWCHLNSEGNKAVGNFLEPQIINSMATESGR